MDNRLVLAVLLVTLSWLSTNATSTSAPTTTASNATATPAMTSASNTTAANATATPAMTSASNTTAANATATPAMTGAPNTTAANATAAPPLTPNTTVAVLPTNISNSGCGTQQLCAAEPSSCDPSGGSSCFFLAAKQQSGQNFDFSLAGKSEGYIAASLSTDNTLGGNDTTYVCANNNGSVVFFGALLNNGMLTKQQLNVNNVKGKVNGNTVQCTFSATVPSSAARASTFSLGISTGSFNSSSNSLGAPSTQLRSNAVNLANANSTVNNLASTNTTTAPNTTSNALIFRQSLTQALLISAGVMGLAML